MAHLVRQTFGDRALERELLALFLQQCDRLLPAIAMANEDGLDERAGAAHSLKGAALAIGAMHVAALAGAVEFSLHGKGLDAAPAGHELERAVAEVARAVTRRCQEVG